MNKNIALILAAFLTVVPLTGCIENISDLKDRVQGGESTGATTPEDVDKASTAPSPVANTTPEPTKNPVARITVFGANGALVFKSSFQADDVAEPIFVSAPVTLQLLASDSEVLQPGAEITSYSWDFAGMKMDGRQISHEIKEAGVFPLMLTIKDSKNGTDSQMITIAVAPEPFDVVTDLTSTEVVGAEQEGIAGTATFDLSTDIEEGKSFKAQAMKIETKNPTTCADVKLEIVNPAGESTTVDAAFIGNEKITIENPQIGTYTINVIPYTCIAPTGVPLVVTVTYVEELEGVAAGDGHNH